MVIEPPSPRNIHELAALATERLEPGKAGYRRVPDRGADHHAPGS